MRKLFAILAVVTLSFISTAAVFAQDEVTEPAATEQVVEDAVTEDAVIEDSAATDAAVEADPTVEGKPMHYVLKEQFLAGGVEWMTPVLLCLVIGLAIVIERIIFLNLSTINTNKFLLEVEEAIKTGGVEAAKEVCRNTRGPVASIAFQGLDRYNEGLEVVEKSIVSYGSVQMGQLESGLSWVSLFIALSPMLGFLGTVVGMVAAFDAIAIAGDISPAVVAGGMKIALLTTIAGLIAAIVLQLFYNYLVSKIDSIVLSMEDSSISLMDIITKYKNK